VLIPNPPTLGGCWDRMFSLRSGWVTLPTSSTEVTPSVPIGWLRTSGQSGLLLPAGTSVSQDGHTETEHECPTCARFSIVRSERVGLGRAKRIAQYLQNPAAVIFGPWGRNRRTSRSAACVSRLSHNLAKNVTGALCKLGAVIDVSDTRGIHRGWTSSRSNNRESSRPTRQSNRKAGDSKMSCRSQRTRKVPRDVVVGSTQSGQEVRR
jgi:hypothetical protein